MASTTPSNVSALYNGCFGRRAPAGSIDEDSIIKRDNIQAPVWIVRLLQSSDFPCKNFKEFKSVNVSVFLEVFFFLSTFTYTSVELILDMVNKTLSYHYTNITFDETTKSIKNMTSSSSSEPAYKICNKCFKEFFPNKVLDLMCVHHAKLRSRKCTKCQFASKLISYEKHTCIKPAPKKRDYKNYLHCDVCKYNARYKKDFATHSCTSSYTCDKCNNKFRSNFLLKKHWQKYCSKK